MRGTGRVTKPQEMLFPPSRSCTGKWDRKYMREQNSLKRVLSRKSTNAASSFTTRCLPFKISKVKDQLFSLNFSKANKFVLASIAPYVLHR